jgi:hypothetical protein
VFCFLIFSFEFVLMCIDICENILVLLFE